MPDEVTTKQKAVDYLFVSLPTIERRLRAGTILMVTFGRLLLLAKETLAAELCAQARRWGRRPQLRWRRPGHQWGRHAA